MGRSLSLQDEDFDLDYPLSVDDEYWETGDPETDFIQPAGIPSRLEAFVTVLKLLRIVESTLRMVVRPVFVPVFSSSDLS